MALQGENLDPDVVSDFGAEWARFDQAGMGDEETRKLFDRYFEIFPWDALPAGAEGFDLGCGSGRWAQLAAQRVATLHCIDPAEAALAVARDKLKDQPNALFHHAGVSAIPLADGSMDFAYSLGVLHHVPDTAAGVASCVAKLKPGAPFLLYLYYALDGKPWLYRAIWKASDVIRKAVSEMPRPLKFAVCQAIAGLVYWPLARTAGLLERMGVNVDNMPLSDYRHVGFYAMKTDALDRFGTRLEQRFTKPQIESMMRAAGLTDIRFSDQPPFWTAVGIKA